MSASKFMNKCITLAKQGLGNTYPNPLVGSLVVYNGRVIGSGWHHKSGEAHAEVHAISSVSDRSLLADSTLYVNLEPCNHHGKTPPCTDLIIQSGIRHVVVGMQDPFEKVNGRGIQKLHHAGVRVDVGIEVAACRELNKRFVTTIEKKRPYIILKWAETADGFLAPRTKTKNEPVWISNLLSRTLAHQWRAEEQSILIGKQTALDDNPALTTRLYNGPSPIRLLIDPKKEVDRKAKVFNPDQKVIVFTANKSRTEDHIEYVTIDFSANGLQQILNNLYERSVQSIIVEGGSITLQHFIDSGLWDEARVITGQEKFEKGITAPNTTSFSAKPNATTTFEGDVLKQWVNHLAH
ncbi:MAG: bifunctional diaminohydroxyphosphoribosylaminopyrimidine deaminase/5-amino-6-(5-phosphoribosylamino)uracil reductase RibD [Flavobacteriaceae bacterium]|nr:bifunctional diaminohydroxyphosphoribosylaminopyrimidine deaminase/5-amino-6-(5-phosphoribosylamino)uracil reductase RibD [Flavobacteriaceae bacterium]